MSKLGTMAGLAWVGPVSCVPLSMRETRAARVRTRTGCGVPRASASERNSICSVIVPADGTRLPLQGNGDFGTSAFFGQLSDKPVLARIR